jgi:hypothetical protein
MFFHRGGTSFFRNNHIKKAKTCIFLLWFLPVWSVIGFNYVIGDGDGVLLAGFVDGDDER